MVLSFFYFQASSKSPEDLSPEDFQLILDKLPTELASKVQRQGLDNLKLLLSGKLPPVKPSPDTLSKLPLEL